MRINESTLVAAPAETIWNYLADPENYLHFMSGITHWEVAGDHANGLGARYRILLRVGAAEVGGLVEMVEWNEPFDIAWHSVTGVDNRGRFRIREQRPGRTRIEYRLAYGVIGGGVAGLLTEIAAIYPVRQQMRRTLRQLKRQVEHEQRRLEAERRRGTRQGISDARASAGIRDRSLGGGDAGDRHAER